MTNKLSGSISGIEDDDLLEKYSTTCDKVSANIKIEFDKKSVCNLEYFKTKIEPHGDEVRDFSDKNIPKVDSNHSCLAVISNQSYNILRKK